MTIRSLAGRALAGLILIWALAVPDLTAAQNSPTKVPSNVPSGATPDGLQPGAMALIWPDATDGHVHIGRPADPFPFACISGCGGGAVTENAGGFADLTTIITSLSTINTGMAKESGGHLAAIDTSTSTNHADLGTLHTDLTTSNTNTGAGAKEAGGHLASIDTTTATLMTHADYVQLHTDLATLHTDITTLNSTAAGPAAACAGSPCATVIGNVGLDTASGHNTVVVGSGTVQPIPATSGGLSVKPITVANNTTSIAVDASPGQFYGIDGGSISSATPLFYKLYNASQGSTTCGSGTVIAHGIVPSPGTFGGGVINSIPSFHGVAFSTAITICLTAGIADTDTTAPAANTYIVNVYYK